MTETFIFRQVGKSKTKEEFEVNMQRWHFNYMFYVTIVKGINMF